MTIAIPAWQTAAMVDAVAGPIPHLCVADGAAALDFYRKAFEAKELARHPAEDGRRVLHAVLGPFCVSMPITRTSRVSCHDVRSKF